MRLEIVVEMEMEILDGQSSGLFLNELFEKRPVMTINDFQFHFDDPPPTSTHSKQTYTDTHFTHSFAPLLTHEHTHFCTWNNSFMYAIWRMYTQDMVHSSPTLRQHHMPPPTDIQTQLVCRCMCMCCEKASTHSTFHHDWYRPFLDKDHTYREAAREGGSRLVRL